MSSTLAGAIALPSADVSSLMGVALTLRQRLVELAGNRTGLPAQPMPMAETRALYVTMLVQKQTLEQLLGRRAGTQPLDVDQREFPAIPLPTPDLHSMVATALALRQIVQALS